MIAAEGGFLDDIWYCAGPSSDVPRGALRRRVLFGEPIAFGRAKSGEVFALQDVCAHRAAPLSAGRIREEKGGATVECPYHGWRYRVADGRCAQAPALVESLSDVSRIAVRRYLIAEAKGLIWIYRSRERDPSAPTNSPPELAIAAARPKVSVVVTTEGPFDEAVVGLVDPAHTPFVHRQWWWRQGAALKEKTKSFVPTPFGFKMPAHAPSSNSRIYRFLGGAPTTEIEFRLPGVRLETIRSGTKTILSLTTLTPIGERAAELRHFMFFDHWLFDPLAPVLQRMGENFLAQDAAILREQNKNLSGRSHRPLFLGDPDEPAKWYLKLKAAYAAREAGAPFTNPLSPATLRWRT